jgi:hypothetical protein
LHLDAERIRTGLLIVDAETGADGHVAGGAGPGGEGRAED